MGEEAMVAGVGPQAGYDDRAVFALNRSVRRLKIWLAVLTTVIVLMILGAVAMFGLWAWGFNVAGSTPSMTSEQKAEVEQEIKDAFGDNLQSLEVRTVKVSYGETPFPYSLMDSTDSEVAYIAYRLKDSDVLVANLVAVGWGQDLASSGMIPTRGSLTSRMTEDEYGRLLAAYGAETSKPLGSVFRYSDAAAYSPSGTSSDEIVVGGKRYPTSELWSATEGVEVDGGRYDSTTVSVTAYIFHEDPATGAFTFLGTEPGATMW